LNEQAPERTAVPFPGSSQMAGRVIRHDWTSTELGPIADWSPSLRTAAGLCLESRAPMVLMWGPALRVLYNDAYLPSMGDKHPDGLGRPAGEVWTEAWDVLGPMLEQVRVTGEPTWSTDLPLGLVRHGYTEETYWTFSFSPVRADDGTVGGLLSTVTETTDGVIAARREALLRDLSVVATSSSTEDEYVAGLVSTVERNRQDVPFARLYEVTGKAVTVLGTAGEFATDPFVGEVATQRTPVELDAGSAVARALAGPGIELLETLADGTAYATHEGGWTEPVRSAAAITALWTQDGSSAVLGLGLSPWLAADERYRAFLVRLGAQVGMGLATVRARRLENDRMAKLVELDLAKTRFLHNISHEFRTPLTITLGGLNAVLADRAEPLGHGRREPLEAARDASVRLRRLVDGLLEAAEAEENRLVNNPEPTDLARLTEDLAAMFRGVAEQAGLSLVIDAPPLSGSVSIDREVWSKIVLNLLSNALKFTAQGGVMVALREAENSVTLSVSDTGAGISAEHQSHVFERFYQTPDTGNRAQNGSGIGLSLVSTLVSALGGEIHLSSEPGRGSTFTVVVPVQVAGEDESGRDLDLIEPLVSDALAAARRPATSAPTEVAEPYEQDAGNPHRRHGTVLLVDDNPDLRGYVTRMLVADGWAVTHAVDGRDALRQLAAGPVDLVLSDVMMSGMDGLTLVQAIRQDEQLRDLPVILLTARAGRDSVVQGLRAGADDYVVKPFDEAELLARLHTHNELAKLRQFALDQVQKRVANLEVALASNRQIGTAIGILMAAHGVSDDGAFELLRAASQHLHRKLRDIAEHVSYTGALPEMPAPAKQQPG
jgi:signal transduction histidine kinase/DNA-binding response OmpR family regulator